MSAIELVSDRDAKTPLDKATSARIYEATYESGTMVRVSGPNMIFSPPLVLTENDVNKILSDLDHGLSQA
jgi:adenosylmethionine-8-amino-7-oxononanoate aminotransferase